MPDIADSESNLFKRAALSDDLKSTYFKLGRMRNSEFGLRNFDASPSGFSGHAGIFNAFSK